MLDEKKKQQILDEEIYRNEVKRQLGEKKPIKKTEKAWIFLNSALGLWLLSTVVIGSTTYFYGRIQGSLDEKKHNVEIKRKLKLEISNKVKTIYELLMETQDSTNIASYQFLTISAYINGGINKNFESFVFNEYKDRTVQSLLYEYASLLNEEETIKMDYASWRLKYLFSEIERTVREIKTKQKDNLNPELAKKTEDFYRKKAKGYIDILVNNPVLMDFLNVKPVLRNE